MSPHSTHTSILAFLLITLITHSFNAGMLSLQTLDSSNKKVGVLTLSAIKLRPLLEARYKSSDLDPSETQSIADFLTDTGYVADNYRQWLAEAHVQTVPILFYKSVKELLDLMDHLDGFVLTGGSEGFFDYESSASRYLEVVQRILQKAKDINDSGRTFPVWGTCLGFEAMLMVESGLTLKRHVVDNHLKLRERIKITSDSLESMRFFTEKELSEMEDLPLLYFNHMFGISRNDVRHLPELKDSVRIGAKINTVRRRNVAVWAEFRKYPFYGTQFHPEKRPIAGANPFDQTPKYHHEGEHKKHNDSPKADEGNNSTEHAKKAIQMPNNDSDDTPTTKHNENDPSPEPEPDQDPSDMTSHNQDSTPFDLGAYFKISNQQNAFFNSTLDPSNQSQSQNFDDGENNFDARSSESANSESEPFPHGDFDAPEPVLNNKDFDFDGDDQLFPAGSQEMLGVHVAVEHETVLPQLPSEAEGVDSAGVSLVLDPQDIPASYLKKIRIINRKFAKFFAQKINAAGAPLPEEFLKKQIYWVKNIGSYYQVNLVKDVVQRRV